MRPTWDDIFVEIAKTISKRSTCNRAQVGAVLTVENRILATGYNGSIKGDDHCTDVGCLIENGHCIRTVHAEMNTIANAAIEEVSTRDTTLYCTHFPCARCMPLLIQSGVKEVVYVNDYGNHEWVDDLIQKAHIKVRKYGDR